MVQNEGVLTFYKDTNTANSSSTLGFVYKCDDAQINYYPIFSGSNKKDYMILDFKIGTSLHTHLEKDVDLTKIILNKSIESKYLAFSDKDIQALNSMTGIGYGYLVCKGYIFKYTVDIIQKNLYSPIVDNF